MVVVSGPPGAGKSTLAVPLAAALGLPLLSKDVIKETLFDALGHVDTDRLASSRRLGAAAMELLWRLAAECPAAVVEANFRSRSPYERDQLRALSPRPVEVYCRLPAALAAVRYAARGARSDHHPVHVMRSLPASAFEEFQEPMGLGPVCEVDTSAPVDVPTLATWVRAALREASDTGSPGTAAHWCNHSCDPNLWHVGPYEIAARRPIGAGEELTVDYATNSGASGFRMRCRCGSPRCRGEITSDDWQRPDLQARYRGHWTPALQARIDGLTPR